MIIILKLLLDKKSLIQLKNDLKIIIENNKDNKNFLLEFIKEYYDTNDNCLYNYFLKLKNIFQ